MTLREKILNKDHFATMRVLYIRIDGVVIKEDLVDVSRTVELYCAQSARVPPQSHTHRNSHPKTPPPPSNFNFLYFELVSHVVSR